MTRKITINNLVLALKAASIWTKFDIIYLFAAHETQLALVNLINPGTFNGTAVGSPTFTTDSCVAASGDNSYIDTFNASTAGGDFTQNSAHYSWYSLDTTPAPDSNRAWIGNHVAGSSGESHSFPTFAGNDFYTRLNDSASSGSHGSSVTSIGHFLGNRSSSSALQGYWNGTQVGSGVTQTSAAIYNATFHICQANGSVSVTNRIAAASFGGSLTSGEVSSFYTALSAYLTRVYAI